jgi:hypothetical protein
MEPSKGNLVAVHEVGHALLAAATRHAILRVTNEKIGDLEGQCTILLRGAEPKSMLEYMLGGIAAEHVEFGVPLDLTNPAWEDDLEGALTQVDKIEGCIVARPFETAAFNAALNRAIKICTSLPKSLRSLSCELRLRGSLSDDDVQITVWRELNEQEPFDALSQTTRTRG